MDLDQRLSTGDNEEIDSVTEKLRSEVRKLTSNGFSAALEECVHLQNIFSALKIVVKAAEMELDPLNCVEASSSAIDVVKARKEDGETKLAGEEEGEPVPVSRQSSSSSRSGTGSRMSEIAKTQEKSSSVVVIEVP